MGHFTLRTPHRFYGIEQNSTTQIRTSARQKHALSSQKPWLRATETGALDDRHTVPGPDALLTHHDQRRPETASRLHHGPTRFVGAVGRERSDSPPNAGFDASGTPVAGTAFTEGALNETRGNGGNSCALTPGTSPSRAFGRLRGPELKRAASSSKADGKIPDNEIVLPESRQTGFCHASGGIMDEFVSSLSDRFCHS